MVINNVSFGLLSVDQWRDNIVMALDSQIQQFKLTPQQRQDLKKEISSRLEKTYEETMLDDRLWDSFACFD